MQWKFELLMKPSGVPLTEGPVWDGEHLYFTHIRASRIMRYDPRSGALAVWREGANRTNGLAYDSQGRLFGCCFGGPDLTTLFVTSTDGHFFRAQTRRVGWAMYP